MAGCSHRRQDLCQKRQPCYPESEGECGRSHIYPETGLQAEIEEAAGATDQLSDTLAHGYADCQ